MMTTIVMTKITAMMKRMMMTMITVMTKANTTTRKKSNVVS
jgi:hypothetical protein